MADTRRLDLKLKRIKAIEGSYRSIIKRAEDEYKHNLITRDKLSKIRRKHTQKIEKLQIKARRLQKLRMRLKTRNA